MTPSIRINLLKWLIIPLLAVNLIGAGLTYWMAWGPTQTALDQSLSDTAWDLVSQIRLADNDRPEVHLTAQAEQILRQSHFDEVYFAVRDRAGKTIAGDKDFPAFHMDGKLNESMAHDGMMRGMPVRIITLQTMVGPEPIFIGVAETLTNRRSVQSRIISTLLLLELALVLLSMGIVWLAVAKGLFPLQRMQAELDRRNHDQLAAVEEGEASVELKPVIRAINGLLNRAQDSAKAQQDFLANIAHQLRTPLAGFKTQVEWLLQKYGHDSDAVQSLTLMMSASERMARQTNQLLALARAEPSQFEARRLEAVELVKLIEESVQYFVQEADKKNIDLGFDLQPTRIMGDRFLLRDLIDNLVDNAIRYSPRNGQVTVKCFQGKDVGTLVVEDSGPGIPLSDQEKIFDRFYRLDDKLTGSGLGLAIVREIAKDHGARIDLKPGPNGKGTSFCVEFPAPP